MSQKKLISFAKAIIKTKNSIFSFWLIIIFLLIIVNGVGWRKYLNRKKTISIDCQSVQGKETKYFSYLHFKSIKKGVAKEVFVKQYLHHIQDLANIFLNTKDKFCFGAQLWLVTSKGFLNSISFLILQINRNYISTIFENVTSRNLLKVFFEPRNYQLNNKHLLPYCFLANKPVLIYKSSQIYFRKYPIKIIFNDFIGFNQKITINLILEKYSIELLKKISFFYNMFSNVNPNLIFNNNRLHSRHVIYFFNKEKNFSKLENSQSAKNNIKLIFYNEVIHLQYEDIRKLFFFASDNKLQVYLITPSVYQKFKSDKLAKKTRNFVKLVIGCKRIDQKTILLQQFHFKLYTPNLLLGNFNNSIAIRNALIFIPVKNDVFYNFAIFPVNEPYSQKSGTFTFKLYSLDSYGIEVGYPLILHGAQIGQVIERRLNEKGVIFTIAIDSLCKNIFRNDTKFIVNSRIAKDAKTSNTKESLYIATYEWANGNGIRIIPGTKGKQRACYPLYASLKNALENNFYNVQKPNLTLNTKVLPDIEIGSNVLYRKLTVGKIVSIRLCADEFRIELYIKPEYCNLISENSIFWAETGEKARLDSNDLKLQTSSLSHTIQHGSISFDNHTNHMVDVSVYQQKNNKHILYLSEFDARASKEKIILHIFDASKLAVGTSIKYLGVDIGKIQNIKIIPDKNEVQAVALLYPEYIRAFARSGTRFSIVIPKISSSGIKNLETILYPYINVEPGKGKSCHDFKLQESTITNSRYLNGLNIELEAYDAGSLEIGSPVLFRGIEVGTVSNLVLDKFSDHVIISLCIGDQYQHLIRNNSVFWLVSGYSLNFSLTNGIIKTGAFNQFIRGGIAFATPNGNFLSTQVKPGQRFLLQEKEPKNWRAWKIYSLK